MKKKHVYCDLQLWEGSSKNSMQLMNLIDSMLENYDEIVNFNEGLFLSYEFFNTLTEEERKKLYLIGEKWLVPIHIFNYYGGVEGPDFAYTLNEKGALDR